MNILLVTTENTLVCIGLRQIAACLKRDGHSVASLFLPRDFNQLESADERRQILSFVRDLKPDLIGCSLMSSHMARITAICKDIKSELASVPIVWGGIHPTLKPAECLDYADFIVRGEGEIVAGELARALEGKIKLTAIKGLCYRENGAIKETEIGPRIEDLDSLPFPDYELQTQFLMHEKCIVPATPEIMRNFIPGLMDTYYIMSGRGCPHSCSYCCNSALRKISSGTYLRRHSPEYFVAEMEKALAAIPYLKGFVFMDDSFLFGQLPWFEKFCSLYQQRIDLPFLCWANPSAIREDIIAMLVKIGLIGVHVGLESGSERVSREIYHRPSDNNQFLKAMAILHHHKKDIVDERVDIITDNPYETESDTIESIHLLNELPKPFFLGIVSLLFYPMTELTEKAEKDGILTDGGVHIYQREFFHYRPTYLNRVMRTLPHTPAFLIEFFIRLRSTRVRRTVFYLYYFGYFIAILRQFKKIKRVVLLWAFKRFERFFSKKYIVRMRVGLIDF